MKYTTNLGGKRYDRIPFMLTDWILREKNVFR